jgi:hypothetical protein
MTGSMKRLGIHAQRHCRLIFNHAGWPKKNLAATDPVDRTYPQSGSERRLRWQTAKVRTNLNEQDVRI